MKSGFLFFLLFCGLLFNTATIFAQNGTITLTGKVLDSETNEALEYATLVLQSVDNPEKVTGGITDVDGKFNVETAPGNYNVRVEFISYKPYVLEQQNLTDSKDFGTIKLSVDVEQLQGVEVTGEKTTVEVRSVSYTHL